jgi:hypothetical protein
MIFQSRVSDGLALRAEPPEFSASKPKRSYTAIIIALVVVVVLFVVIKTILGGIK